MEVKKMESLKELYKIGRGPSSSHTMGPEKACKIFKEHNPKADRFEAILYGSLSKRESVTARTRLSKSHLTLPLAMLFSTMKILNFRIPTQWT